MDRFPQGEFVYIGDNLKKDFVTANRLGWTTICLRDQGDNIHAQDWSSTDSDHTPAYTVLHIEEVLDIII